MIEGTSSGRVAVLRNIAGVCGIASQLVPLTVWLVAIASSPWFSWTENKFSDFRVKGSAASLFNSGLILSGILSLVFAIGIRKTLLSSRLGELGVASLILGSIALSGIGAFPETVILPHNLASIAFFVFSTLAPLLVGVAAITASRMTWGLLSLTTGTLKITLALAPWPWSGNAIPMLLYSLPSALWTIVFAVALLVKSRPVDVKKRYYASSL